MRPSVGKIARRKFLLSSALLSLFPKIGAAESLVQTNQASTNKTSAASASKIVNLNDLLEPLRAAGKVPALASAVIVDGKIKGVGAVGIRKGGSPMAVKGTDLWHVGSCTKPMTSTLIAMFVERQRLKWETTIADALPDLRNSMHAAYRDVTVEQLLTHRAGLHPQADAKLWDAAWASRAAPMDQRYEFVKGTLAKEPESTPGTRYDYSNQSYAVAGVMLEKIVGQPWETLMREQLFKPLLMTSSGFGVPGTIGQIDQPWGHKWKNGKLEPQQQDNPPAIAPAAAVHCSIWDFARFTMFHLHGARGEIRLLKPETFTRLHTPPAGQDYAMGWSRQDRNWANGYTLNHAGSNTLNFAVIWIAPKINFAAVSATNIGGDSGEKACDETIQALIKKFVTTASS
jgi:CubicO group peptidase (beta-lactamase class C family)